MKKNFMFAAIVAAVLSVTSCGMGGGTNTLSGSTIGTSSVGTTTTGTASSLGGVAGSVLGGVLGGSTGSTLGSTAGSLLGNVLSNMLNIKTTQASLEGTWTYNSPKVIFESESILAQLGGQIASSKIESTASTYLSKLGMTPGTSTITFNNNGTCVFGLNGRQVQGTYTYNSETSQLTMVGAFGLANVTCYATVKLNELELVFDANSLLSLASKATSSISSGNMLSSLLGNYNGLKIGMAMTR